MKFAAGWGDGLSSCTVSRAETVTPPRLAFRFAPCEPTLPLQGRVKRCAAHRDIDEPFPIRLPCRKHASGKNAAMSSRPRHRSGHHLLARDCVPAGHLHRRFSPAGIPAAFSRIRLGRARAGGHLDLHRRHLPRGVEKSRPHGKGHRRHRHHQPARDHRGVGPRHRAGDPPRHRLAGPPHRRHLRETEGRRPRARDLRQDRADHRSVFLRHESRVDPRPRPRRARTRDARRTDVRHRRLLSAVAADRRQASTPPTPPTPRARCCSTSTAANGTTSC